MSKISPKRRQFEIRKKRKRRKKLKKLREKYLHASTKEEKEKIAERIKKIAPYLTLEEVLGVKEEEKK